MYDIDMPYAAIFAIESIYIYIYIMYPRANRTGTSCIEVVIQGRRRSLNAQQTGTREHTATRGLDLDLQHITWLSNSNLPDAFFLFFYISMLYVRGPGTQQYFFIRLRGLKRRKSTRREEAGQRRTQTTVSVCLTAVSVLPITPHMLYRCS